MSRLLLWYPLEVNHFRGLGAFLRSKRKEKNLTLVQAAEAAGLSRSYVAQIEKTDKASLSAISSLLSEYGATLTDLASALEPEGNDPVREFEKQVERRLESSPELRARYDKEIERLWAEVQKLKGKAQAS